MYWTNDPYRLINQLSSVNQIFKEMESAFAPLKRGNSETSSYPRLNVWANKDGATVTAEIPGVEVDSLQVSTHETKVTIAGTVPGREKGENDAYQRSERFNGKFQREITLPFRVNSQQVTADYQNGVLKVTLPQAEEDKPKKITVSAS